MDFHNETDELMVSVIVLTYNHGRYINQALDSVLNQEVSFKYEILVGDDASPDNTQEILLKYQEKEPDIIKLNLRKKNIGGVANGYDLLRKAKGKYIAYLEGDDYWIDTRKLQKQFEFLEANPEYIGSVHTCLWVDKNGNQHAHIRLNYNHLREGDYTIEFLRDGWWDLPGQPSTFMYHNIYLREPQNEEKFRNMHFLDKVQSDRSVTMILLSYGKIRCINECMAHYRLDTTSATSHAGNFTINVKRRVEMFRYLQKLEAVSEDTLGVHLVFDRRKELLFKQIIAMNDSSPTLEKKAAINRVIACSGDKKRYKSIYSSEKKHLKKAKSKNYIKTFFKTIRDKWHAQVQQDLKNLQVSINQSNTQIIENKKVISILTGKIDSIELQHQELVGLGEDQFNKLLSQYQELVRISDDQFKKLSFQYHDLVEQCEDRFKKLSSEYQKLMSLNKDWYKKLSSQCQESSVIGEDGFNKLTSQYQELVGLGEVRFNKLSSYFEKSPYYNDYYTTFKGIYGSLIGLDEINYLVQNYEFETVLDIGSGAGHHSKIFVENNKKVTAIDIGDSFYFHDRIPIDNEDFTQIIADYNENTFYEQFDCIWCCMVLEHQHNVGWFLKKLHSDLKENGVLAIIVPPLKSIIVGGHVTLWNAGLLLYNLVIAGFDCYEASVWSHDYDICIIVRKKTVDVSDRLTHDFGDIKAISEYLPTNLEWHINDGDSPFNGIIEKLNWG